MGPVAFGVTAGATKALGDFGDVVDVGYNVGGLLEWGSTPSLPFGIRIDGAYHRFSVKEKLLTGSGVDANASITTGTANAVFQLPMGTGATIGAYVIGGAGIYHLNVSASCADCGEPSMSESRNKFGLNGGGGLKVPLSGFSAFVEARYHHIFTDDGATKMVPVSFGVVFHP
jgi:hypothetical protein